MLDPITGHELLTTVEDSLETMLEILREMGSLVIAPCPSEKAAIEYSRCAAGSNSGLTVPADPCRCARLGLLQRELRDVMKGTRIDGLPLLDATSAPPPLFIDLAPDAPMRIALEGPGSTLSQVASIEVNALSPDLQARAVIRAEALMATLLGLRNRLNEVMEVRSVSARGGGSDSAELLDAESARAQLSLVGRRIVEDAFEAVLAQANVESRLVDFLYRQASPNTLTRIYPLAGGPDSDA